MYCMRRRGYGLSIIRVCKTQKKNVVLINKSRYSFYSSHLAANNNNNNNNNNNVSNENKSSKLTTMEEKVAETVMEFSITPISLENQDGNESIRKGVLDCVHLVSESKLKYKLTAMDTIVEGRIEDCLLLLEKCINKTLETYPRVITDVRFDARPQHGKNRIEEQSLPHTQSWF